MLASSYEQLLALYNRPSALDGAYQGFCFFAQAPSMSAHGSVLVDGSILVNSPTVAIEYPTTAIWSRLGSFNDSDSQASLFADFFLSGLRSWVRETPKLSQRDFWRFSNVVLSNSPIEWATKAPFEPEPLIYFDLKSSNFDVKVALQDSIRLRSGPIWQEPNYLRHNQTSYTFERGDLRPELSAGAVRSIFKVLTDDLGGLKEAISLRDFAGLFRTILLREVFKRSTYRFRRVVAKNSRTRRHPATARNRVLGRSILTGVSPPDTSACLRPVAGVGSWACLVYSNAQESGYVETRRRNHAANLSDEVCSRHPATRIGRGARGLAAARCGNITSRYRCARRHISVALSPRTLRDRRR